MGDSAQVEQESQSAPQTTADLIRATMSETYRPASRADIPLNGPDVILPQAATRTRPTRLRGIPRVPDSARAHDRLRERRRDHAKAVGVTETEPIASSGRRKRKRT
jgi:hypothetical protein